MIAVKNRTWQKVTQLIKKVQNNYKQSNMGIMKDGLLTDLYNGVLAVWCLLLIIGRYYLYYDNGTQ